MFVYVRRSPLALRQMIKISTALVIGSGVERRRQTATTTPRGGAATALIGWLSALHGRWMEGRREEVFLVSG